MPGGQVEEGESYQNVKESICNTLFLARKIGGEPRNHE
jgi:hypothetical protein